MVFSLLFCFKSQANFVMRGGIFIAKLTKYLHYLQREVDC